MNTATIILLGFLGVFVLFSIILWASAPKSKKPGSGQGGLIGFGGDDTGGGGADGGG